MKHATLYRDYGLNQTLGHFNGYDGLKHIFSCKTLELPWLNNKENISCIPGFGSKYLVKEFMSPSKGKCYKFEYVIDRSYIEIHVGNFVDDILGCVLPGEYFIDIDNDGLMDVSYSSRTLCNMFRAMGDEFYLTII